VIDDLRHVKSYLHAICNTAIHSNFVELDHEDKDARGTLIGLANSAINHTKKVMSEMEKLTVDSDDQFWYEIEAMAHNHLCSILGNASLYSANENIDFDRVVAHSIDLALDLRGQIIKRRAIAKGDISSEPI